MQYNFIGENGVIAVFMLHPNATLDHVGFIPSFLNMEDERSATEQFNANYISGWRHQDKVTITKDGTMLYPGDPPLKPIAFIQFREEKIYIYEYGYVAVVQPDGTFEACRMD